ncbi:MAG: hypothetical protein AAGA57_12690 [Planctomycetota bacterium]
MTRLRPSTSTRTCLARATPVALAATLLIALTIPTAGCAGNPRKSTRSVDHQTGTAEMFTRGDLDQVSDQTVQALRDAGLIRLTVDPVDNGQSIRAFTPGGTRVITQIAFEPDGRLYLGVRVGTFGNEAEAARYADAIAERLRR